MPAPPTPAASVQHTASDRPTSDAFGAGSSVRHDRRVQLTAAAAIANAHLWFELNSGWAPPDEDTLAEWLANGVCRCPDECLVARRLVRARAGVVVADPRRAR